MKKTSRQLLVCSLALLGAALAPHTLLAVPYASSITESGGLVNFYLNEPADNVRVIFSGPASTNNLGALPKGPGSFSRGAAASYRIEVTKSTASAWTQISASTNEFLHYFSPGGIAINNNPANLALFGRIYIANNVEGNAATAGPSRPTEQGIYILNPDQSDGLGQGTFARTAGIPFIAGTSAEGAASPFKIEVGPDNNLYISDYSGANANIYRTDPDVTTFEQLLDGIGADANTAVHTTINGSAIAKGTTAGNNLVVYAVDGRWPGSNNRLLRWDINGSTLPFTGAPTPLATAPISTVVDVQSDLDIAPDGKIFITQNRAIGTSPTYDATRVNLRVYQSDGVTLLWDSFAASIAAGMTNDFLFNSRGVKVSPDGKSIAVSRNDTRTWIVGLTDGVPDITKTNLLTTTGTSGSAANRREVSFDAAGNLYVGNNSHEVVAIWSPGGTTTATTTSSGTFSIATPQTVLSISNSVASITEGGSAMFTVSRSGDTASILAVPYTISGTASNNVDYQALSGTITFAAGASSTNLALNTIDDAVAELTETVTMTLNSSPSYSITAPGAATISILDNESPEISVTQVQPILLEGYGGAKATLQVVRRGLITPALSVNLAYAGTATRGVDYNSPSSVALAGGTATVNFNVTPIDDSAFEGDETILCTAAAGTGYDAASNAGTVTIIDDEYPPAPVLFSDSFDTDSSANWMVNIAGPGDAFADFNFNYSALGIPSAPYSSGGTTLGVKFTANTSQGLVNAVSMSPLGRNFTGNYRLEFDMWINVNGPLQAGGTGSTEHFNAGIGTTGDHPNWFFGASDGAWFSADGDGGTGAVTGDYNAYFGFERAGDASGAYVAGTAAGVRDNFNPFYALWGGVAAPALQLSTYPQQTGAIEVGSFGMAWHRVAITKIGEVVNWSIDGRSIANLTNTPPTSFTTTGNIFVGYHDQFASISDNIDLSFGLVDNVRVLDLSATTQPVITGISLINGGTQVQINFTGGAADAPSAFTLLSSGTVNGSFGAATAAMTGGSGLFQATVSLNGSAQFYRIQR